MPSANRNSSNSKTFRKQNKKTEINMSALSTVQKQVCIKLLVDGNIDFEQGKEGFEAQLRIDLARLTTQFCAQKQVQPSSTLIRKGQRIIGAKKTVWKQKQNITPLKPKNSNNQQPKARTKSFIHPIYTNSKKYLSKTIKINNLTQIQKLHPFIQLYIYPRKVSFQSLIQLIQEIYDFYWRSEINGEKAKQNRNRMMSNHTTEMREKQKYHKNPSKTIKITQTQQKLPYSSIKQKRTFCHWVYENFILAQKQRMKVQQLLVNLIQSLNHFSYKHLGIQIFYNFLSGIYPLDALNYFLVTRTMLQQIYQQKIIEKVPNYGSKSGVIYKMKLNPYEKFIQEQKVYDFLEVCCCSAQNQSVRQGEAVNIIFQQMTENMFFEQREKKNYIHFFQMAKILLNQFSKAQTVNTTNLQLSFTQQNYSLNDLLFKQHQQMMQRSTHNDQDLQLTFQVQQNQQGGNLQQPNRLNEYFPDDTCNELEMKPQQSQESNFQAKFYQQVLKKYTTIQKSLKRSNYQDQIQNSISRQILKVLYQSVVKIDKDKWIQFIRKQQVTPQKQSQQLFFIQKLQMEYARLKNCKIISNQFIKKMLTASYFKKAILHEARINF